MNTSMLSGAMRGLAVGALAGVAYGLGRVTTQIVKMAAELESTTIAFEVMLRSATKATSLVAYGKEFAKVTPFTQRQVFGNMRQLLAYGAPEQNIRGYNRMLSTIAAGVGQERLPYLTLALGQVIAKGRLQGQELRQFTEHGVGLVQGLAAQKGVSTGSVYDLMRKGQISSQDVVNVMKALTEEGGLFYGMLERLRQSFTGTMNVMKSSWQLALVDAVQPFMRGMKLGMEKLISLSSVVYDLIPTLEVLTIAFSNMFEPFREMYRIASAFTGTTAMDAIVTLAKYFASLMVNTFSVLESIFTIGLEMFKPMFQKFTNVYEAYANNSGILNQAIAMRMALEKPVKGGDIPGALMGVKRKWEGMLNTIWRGSGKSAAAPDMSTGGLTDLLSTTGDEDVLGAAAKKKVANRLIGTGTRDIVIHIGNLIENMNMNNAGVTENAEEMTERVKVALLTAINDASILADR